MNSVRPRDGVLLGLPAFQPRRQVPISVMPSRAPETVAQSQSRTMGAPTRTGAAPRGGATESRQSFNQLINAASRRHSVDPDLVTAVIQAESGFNPSAVSHAGAKGLMQLMDGTARMLGVTDSFDPRQNIEGGTKFLGEMLRRYRSPSLALAAYNAGPGAVDSHGGVPPYRETQTYVKRVLDYQRRIEKGG